jgi:hypothetical protein
MQTRHLLIILTITGLAACSNIAEKRSELAAAGFRTIPAISPAQLAHLSSIKSTKVVPLKGPKGVVYVFADHGKKALMVGSPAQYQNYRSIKLRQQRVDEQLLEAQTNMDQANWSAWGPDSVWGWGPASDPY